MKTTDEISLPFPNWLDDWPIGLWPSRLTATSSGVSWFYERGRRPPVRLHLPVGTDLRPHILPKTPASSAEIALLQGVHRRLLLIGAPVRQFVERAATLARRRHTLSKELDPSTLLGGGDRSTVAAKAVWALGAGDVNQALEALESYEETEAHPLSGCTVLIEGFLGRPVRARALAIRLAERVLGDDRQRALARALRMLCAYDAALALAHLVALRSERPDDLREVGQLAALRRDADVARQAYDAAVATAAPASVLTDLAESLFCAGDPEGAAERLEELWRSTRHLDAGTRLAELSLYRGDAARVIELADEILQQEPGHLSARRARGAARVLAGEVRAALSDLDAVLAELPSDPEARLWKVEGLREAGDAEESSALLRPGGFADHPVWQLQRRRDLQERGEARPWQEDSSSLSLLAQMYGADSVLQVAGDDAATRSLIDRALRDLGGNRTSWPTRVVGGRLRPLFELSSPRTQAVEAQATVLHEPAASVLAQLSELSRRDGFSPFAETYSAELRLWLGEYEAAVAIFDRLWARTRTRWSYVGGGAARMLLGRYDEALARWEEGRLKYTYLPQEATFAYRGELYWRTGNLTLAWADLEHAVKETPSRIGAWVVLGLVALDDGRPEDAQRAIETLGEHVPVLLWEGRRAAGVTARGRLEPDAARAALAACLEMLRGNRSSSIYTFWDACGTFRVFGRSHLDVWKELALKARPFVHDVLVERLLATI